MEIFIFILITTFVNSINTILVVAKLRISYVKLNVNYKVIMAGVLKVGEIPVTSGNLRGRVRWAVIGNKVLSGRAWEAHLQPSDSVNWLDIPAIFAVTRLTYTFYPASIPFPGQSWYK
jgi:hypothetical protein